MNGYVPELSKLKEGFEGSNNLILSNGHLLEAKETDGLLKEHMANSSRSSKISEGSNSVFEPDSFLPDKDDMPHEKDEIVDGQKGIPCCTPQESSDERPETPDELGKEPGEVPETTEDMPDESSENIPEDKAKENIIEISGPTLIGPAEVEENLEELRIDRPYSLHIDNLDILENTANKTDIDQAEVDSGVSQDSESFLLISQEDDEEVNLELNKPCSMKVGYNGLVINIEEISNINCNSTSSLDSPATSSPIIIASSPTDRPISKFDIIYDIRPDDTVCFLSCCCYDQFSS